jgi:hypothetical protein
VVVDFDNAETRMLHVVGTQTAVVGTPVLHYGIEELRHFGLLDEYLSPQTVVGYIIADKDTFSSVRRAPFVHEYQIVLKQDFGLNRIQARRTKRGGSIVKQVGTRLT